MPNARTPADSLRRFADMLDAGTPADEIGPYLFLIARAMCKRTSRKPPK